MLIVQTHFTQTTEGKTVKKFLESKNINLSEVIFDKDKSTAICLKDLLLDYAIKCKLLTEKKVKKKYTSKSHKTKKKERKQRVYKDREVIADPYTGKLFKPKTYNQLFESAETKSAFYKLHGMPFKEMKAISSKEEELRWLYEDFSTNENKEAINDEDKVDISQENKKQKKSFFSFLRFKTS